MNITKKVFIICYINRRVKEQLCFWRVLNLGLKIIYGLKLSPDVLMVSYVEKIQVCSVQ